MTRHDCDNWSDLIHASVDGEMSELEQHTLERELERCADCRERAAALLQMGELVRLEVDTAAERVDFGALWPALNARLESVEATSPQTANADSALSVDALTLQAFADGQLTGKELAGVASRVARSEHHQGQLNALAEMGELVRVAVESEAEAADYNRLWSRLDAAVGEELRARGGFRTAAPDEEERRAGFFERLWEAVGGYRSIAMSVATAAIIVLFVLPAMQGEPDQSEERAEPIEIRVVHINEVRSDPGYAVTVDAFNDGTAPVIYVRPEGERSGEEQDEQPNGLFDDPI